MTPFSDEFEVLSRIVRNFRFPFRNAVETVEPCRDRRYLGSPGSSRSRPSLVYRRGWHRSRLHGRPPRFAAREEPRDKGVRQGADLVQVISVALLGIQLTLLWTRSAATPARPQAYDARGTSRPRTRLRVPPPATLSAPGRRSPRYSGLATTFRSPRSPGQTESCRQQDGGASGSNTRAVALAHGGGHTTVRRRATR